MSLRKVAFVSIFALLAPSGANAQEGVRLRMIPDDDPVSVDGLLREWADDLVFVGSGQDAAFGYALAASPTALYVAARVHDDRLVRTSSFGADEDAVILTYVAGGQSHEVWIFAGDTGRSESALRLGAPGGPPRRPIPNSDVVEAPLEGRVRGYTIEARIPFAALGRADDAERARIAIRLRDVDAEAQRTVEAEPSTFAVDPHALDRVPEVRVAGGERGILERFLVDRGLVGRRPSHELRGDVAGDATPERVAIVDGNVVVFGRAYRDGEGYGFVRLPIDRPDDVIDARLVDFTGAGKAQLGVRVRERDARGTRDLFSILALDGATIRPIFRLELRKEVDGVAIESDFEVARARRGAPSISVHVRPNPHAVPEAFREDPDRTVQRMLLPWGPVLARSYRWDGQRFAVAEETPNPDFRAALSPPTGPGRGTGSLVAPPAPPAAPAIDDDQRLRAALGAQGRPTDARPRFRVRTNVAEDGTLETVAVYGRELVVVGPGFRGGESFFYTELPIETDDDLVRFENADVTADGRDELLFFLRQRSGSVERTLVFVHRFSRRGFERALVVEVSRVDGDRSVANDLRITGRGSARTIVVRPGRARGYDASSWPFRDAEGGEIAPLLLPWRDSAVRFRFDADHFVREPQP